MLILLIKTNTYVCVDVGAHNEKGVQRSVWCVTDKLRNGTIRDNEYVKTFCKRVGDVKWNMKIKEEQLNVYLIVRVIQKELRSTYEVGGCTRKKSKHCTVPYSTYSTPTPETEPDFVKSWGSTEQG